MLRRMKTLYDGVIIKLCLCHQVEDKILIIDTIVEGSTIIILVIDTMLMLIRGRFQSNRYRGSNGFRTYDRGNRARGNYNANFRGGQNNNNVNRNRSRINYDESKGSENTNNELNYFFRNAQ